MGLIPSLWIGATQKSLAANLDLREWEQFGDVLIDATGDKADLSTNGLFGDDAELGRNDEDFNFSGNPAGFVGFGGLEEFLGVDVQQLDVEGFAYEGSAIKTDLIVNPGDILRLEWQFFTNETSSSLEEGLHPFRDYAFLLADGEIRKFADYEQSQNSSSFFDSETNTERLEYVFQNQATQTVAFGVIDVDDFFISSALSIHNVEIVTESLPPGGNIPQTVPEADLWKTLVIITAMAIGVRLKNSLDL
ncbi:MAG: hypothetical protein QNJ42_17660 [Crocosphaera sp.]|nr:hypothetical protein [Crocosphaera sp.]